MLSRFVISFFPKEQAFLNFKAAVTTHGGFGAQENKVCHCFHFPHSVSTRGLRENNAPALWGLEGEGADAGQVAGGAPLISWRGPWGWEFRAAVRSRRQGSVVETGGELTPGLW